MHVGLMEIKADLEEFMSRENRFNTLTRTKKDVADKLHKQLKENIDKKLARLIAQSQQKPCCWLR